MKIAVGCDHAGFPLKAQLLPWFAERGHEVLDRGTFSTDPVDYPDYSRAVGMALVKGEAQRGILICGSGVGACIAANKIKGIRAGICHDTFSARQGVEDDDMNVICIGARVVGSELAKEIITAFLNASFSHLERHERRVKKILDIEARGG